MLLMLLGYLLGALGSLLEASWGHHRASWQPLGGLLGSFRRPLGVSWRPLGALGELLGSLGSLLAASWGSWRAPWVSWEPLGSLFGVSWDLLAGLEAEKWPWLEREHDF